jgi:hypothetical protein
LGTLPDCASAPAAKRQMLAAASRLSFQFMMVSSANRMVWLLDLCSFGHRCHQQAPFCELMRRVRGAGQSHPASTT